jgi:hypothetical protein
MFLFHSHSDTLLSPSPSCTSHPAKKKKEERNLPSEDGRLLPKEQQTLSRLAKREMVVTELLARAE